MSSRSPSVIFILVSTIFSAVSLTTNAEKTPFELRDAAIRSHLVGISTGKLPPNDDDLINLIAENIREVSIKANNPTAGIDAAARQAQEAVSEVTAAYTAIIFQSKSLTEAQRIFTRFNDTVQKIVDITKSGNFVLQ